MAAGWHFRRPRNLEPICPTCRGCAGFCNAARCRQGFGDIVGWRDRTTGGFCPVDPLRHNDGIEPIDSLQIKFDLAHNCNPVGLVETKDFSKSFSIYPNPSSEYLTIHNKTEERYNLYQLSK